MTYLGLDLGSKTCGVAISDRTGIITLEFRDMLIEKFHKEVFMQDERLSTVEAENLLISNDTNRKNRKKVIDKIAASIILQAFLDRRSYEK